MNRELTRSEQGYQDIFDNIDAAIWTFDKETSFITVSAGFEKMLGFSREELFRNPSIWEETIYEEDLEMVSLHMAKLYSGLSSTLEHRIRFRTGEIRWVQSAGTSVYHKENHAVRINGVLLDITEKKAAQEELEKTRHLFQRILNTVDVAIWSYSEVSQRIEYVSEALEEITGYPLNKIMTRENWKDIIHHDDIFIFEQLSVKVRQGISDASEYRIIHANGEVRWIQNRIIPTMDGSGYMTRLDGVVIDITSRKMMEEALHRNEQRYKSLFEYNSDVICELDLSGNILAFNQVAGKSLFGNKNSSWVDILGSVGSQRAAVYFEMAKQGQALNYEIVSNHQNGKKVHWDIKNVPIYVNHDVVGIFVIGRDITQKKETEKALAESEAQYKFIAENMTDMVRILDANGMCIYASPSHKKLIGYPPEQYMEEQIFLRMVHPDDLEAVGLLFNEMVESKQPKNAQFRVTRADGEHIYLEEYGTPVVDHNGKVENIVIVSRDITEKKLTEKALAESESQFRLIAGNMTDLLGLLDIKGTFWYASPSYQKVLGFDHEWMVGTSLFDRLHPDDLAEAQNQFLEMLLTKTTKPVRCRFIHSEGRTVEVDCLGTPVLSQDGEVESIIVVSRDITDKVQMEKELTESEERYRTLIEHSPQPMASHCDGKFVYINPAGIELIGAKDANEIIGKSVFSIIHPDYMKMARKRAQSLTKNKYLESMEYKMIRLDGQMIEVELIGIYDDATQTTLTVFSDITERKKNGKGSSRERRTLSPIGGALSGCYLRL